MSFKPAFHVLWVLAACFVINNASAEERWYNVELLVFKHARAEHFLTEQWPTTWSIPDTGDSVDPLDIQKAYSQDFEKLPAGEQSFAGIIDNMEKSSRYEVLAYRGWRQKGLDKDQALNVRIQAGRTYRKDGQPFADSGFSASTPAVSPSGSNPQPLAITGTLFEPVLDENGQVIGHVIPQYTLITDTDDGADRIVHELDGSVKIVLSRFLHIYTDLLLLEPVNLTPERNANKDDNLKTATDLVEEAPDNFEAAEAEKPITPAAYRLSLASDDAKFTTLHGFNIHSHRRMRSEELHHLDHPLLGILVKVTPSEN